MDGRVGRAAGIRTSQRPPGRLAGRWLAMLDALDERLKGRVLRGRTLSRAGRVSQIEVAPGAALAEVQDPDPKRPTVRVRTFEEAEWTKVLATLRSKLTWLGKLLEGEVHDELLAALDATGIPLVPRPDEIDGDCDCGDWAVPCTHGAALHHVLGEALDGEPFLLFTLRGRTREQLLSELRRGWGDTASPRGKETHPPDVEPTGDPFASPVPPPILPFRFTAGPPGMMALGPLAGDDDLPRALQPLYDAGAAAAHAIALAEGDADAPRRRRRSTVPQVALLPPAPSIAPSATRAKVPAAPEFPARPLGAEFPARPLGAEFPLGAGLPLDPGLELSPAAGPEDLTERIVDLLAEADDGATAEELGRKLGVTTARAQAELEELGNLGLVYRSGRGPGRWWLG
ncbi:MAG: hypothetical protein ABMB14_12810 [Myxococcota bacterium]